MTMFDSPVFDSTVHRQSGDSVVLSKISKRLF